MDELIARVAAAVGVEADVAKSAIGHILAFLQKEAPEGAISELLNKLPGAQEMIEVASGGGETGGAGGLLGGLMGGGLMGLAAKLNGLGLDMSQMQALAKETLAHAEGVIGKENLDKITASIPGLSQFL